ncbi:MAG: sensor histidine kinase [Cellulosilyticaceae bacterium]
MKKLKLTLKWRFTLLTICLLTLSSIAIVVAMNFNVGRTLPSTTTTIMDMAQTESVNGGGITMSQPTMAAYEGVMQGAAATIYMDSIFLLIVIICVGGVTAYIIANQALKPVQALSHQVQTINETNWSTHLEVQGPHDEIQELAFSFNQMIAKLNNVFISQKRFNARVAHELKTPLTAIKTNIDLLNDGEDKTLQGYQETLDVVEKSVVKMNAMIETLLDLVKEENAALDDQVVIPQIIEDVIEDLTVVGESHQVELDYTTQSPITPIKGNEVLLYRAIYNLVENAIKYNKPQGYVHVSCEQTQGKIKIVIKDTGKGIAKEAIDHIFEPFYRVDAFNTERINGMGLGLSFVQSTVKVHGGEVEVQSEINEGTVITLTLNTCRS